HPLVGLGLPLESGDLPARGRYAPLVSGGTSCGKRCQGPANVVAAGAGDHARAAVALDVEQDSAPSVDERPNPPRSDENLRSVYRAVDGEHGSDLRLSYLCH